MKLYNENDDQKKKFFFILIFIQPTLWHLVSLTLINTKLAWWFVTHTMKHDLISLLSYHIPEKN